MSSVLTELATAFDKKLATLVHIPRTISFACVMLRKVLHRSCMIYTLSFMTMSFKLSKLIKLIISFLKL